MRKPARRIKVAREKNGGFTLAFVASNSLCPRRGAVSSSAAISFVAPFLTPCLSVRRDIESMTIGNALYSARRCRFIKPPGIW